MTAVALERHAFAYRMKEESFQDFRAFLGRKWSEIKELLDGIDAANFSLWGIGCLVFGYYETEGKCVQEPCRRKAQELTEEAEAYGTWISSPLQSMRLMYQDFGVVRPSKELIRHRVFATQLKGDFQEEYKRRHDALVEARGGAVTPGPDSNFSIWNAGRYIFGYDEIDITMEEAETEETRQSAIAWETKMLEIMDWFTDDVDWITGERHPHVVRLAWYR